MPDDLIDWTMEVHKAQIRDLRQQDDDYLKEPPRPPSNKGRPHYAMDNRNMWFVDAFVLLGYLGLESEAVRRHAIAEECNVDIRTVKDAIKAGMQQGRQAPGTVGVLAPSRFGGYRRIGPDFTVGSYGTSRVD